MFLRLSLFPWCTKGKTLDRLVASRVSTCLKTNFSVSLIHRDSTIVSHFVIIVVVVVVVFVQRLLFPS